MSPADPGALLHGGSVASVGETGVATIRPPPVSVAFVLTGGGRIVATPFSPTDATLPPCNGAPGSAGDIEMQPWAR